MPSSDFKCQSSTYSPTKTAVHIRGNGQVPISIPVKLQDAVRRDLVFLVCCQIKPWPTPCSHFSCYFLHLPDTLPPSGLIYRTQGCSGVLSRPDRRCTIRLFRLTIIGNPTQKIKRIFFSFHRQPSRPWWSCICKKYIISG